MEEAVTRLKLAADAGADVCFIEGVKTEELLKSTVAALAPKPVLVNVISGGLTPSFTTKEAEQMGAKIIIFSLVSCVAMVHALREAMALLKKTGTDHTSARGMDPRKFFEVVGLISLPRLIRQVDWPEINAAWGLALFCLHSLARKVGFVFAKCVSLLPDQASLAC